MGSFIRTWAQKLLKIQDTPERTALAFSIGVFLAFSPLLGLHTLVGLGIAFAFNLNRAAMLVGIYTNTPWTIVPYYSFATLVGLIFYDTPGGLNLPEFGLSALLSLEFYYGLLRSWRLLIPVVIGSTLMASLLALIAYPLCLWLIKNWKQQSDWKALNRRS